MKKKTMAHYFEYYPHYSGDTLKREATFDPLVLAFAVTLYNEREKFTGYDAFDDFMESVEKDGGIKSYAFCLLFVDNGYELRKTLKKRDTWSGLWEEGSQAVSLVSMKEAKRAVAAIEARLAYNEIGDE